MPSMISAVFGPFAMASVDVAVGGPATFAVQLGFVKSIVYNGTGDTTLELKEPIDLDKEAIVHVTSQDDQAARIAVEPIDLTHLRVRTFQTGAASDKHYWISIWPFPATLYK